MKKVYLLAGALATGLAATAQFNTNAIPAAKNARDLKGFTVKKASASVEKSEGQVYWSDDFSTPSNWTISNLGASGTPPHTAGDWSIVTALPSSLTDQAPSYGFPTAMNSTSGGNFALVDSDEEGAGQTQNALIGTTSGIDLTAAGSASLYLVFTEIYRHYYDENYVQVSNDGGTTWTEFQVNPVAEVPVNTNSGDPEVEIVNISSVIGAGTWSNNVKVRFRYQGAWDWFWAIDDVKIVEAWNNDVKMTQWAQATDLNTTQGLDYYIVNQSQASFPGLTFGAYVNNNGALDQAAVGLHVTAPSLSYDETGSTIALASGATDSVTVDVPLVPSATVGDYAVTVSSSIGSTTDSDPSNNSETFTLRRDQWVYSRDNGIPSGSIAQLQSQDNVALKVGNIMEIFDEMNVSFVQVRLMDQSTAVGQLVFAEIYKFDGDWTFLAGTQDHEITDGDLDGFVSIPLDGGALTVEPGDVLLVVAGHYDGPDEVAFGMAQPTFEGTVQGFTSDGTGFQLTDPGAIMIRLSDQTLGVNENMANFSLNVFPNPAVDQAKVSFELTNASDVTVTVTDLSGKTVYTNAMGNTSAGKHDVQINTAALAGGIYAVNFSADNASVTKKLVVKK